MVVTDHRLHRANSRSESLAASATGHLDEHYPADLQHGYTGEPPCSAVVLPGSTWFTGFL